MENGKNIGGTIAFWGEFLQCLWHKPDFETLCNASDVDCLMLQLDQRICLSFVQKTFDVQQSTN